MPPPRVADFLSHLNRRREDESVFGHSPSDDSGAESEPEDIPLFKSDITQICETCTKIDLAFMFQRAGKFMGEACKYTYQIGTLQEIQAKAGECQLCRAWLQLLPKVEAHADRNYTEQSIFSLEPSTSFPTGIFEVLGRGPQDRSLRTVSLHIWDNVNRFGGAEFVGTVNDGSFYLKRDDIRWNEILLQVDFSLPLKWMKFCVENHQTCSTTRGPQLEKVLSVFRLIDCERTLSSGELHVISPDVIPEYTALSYVWGEQPDDGSSEQAPSGDNTGVEDNRDKPTKNRLENLPKVIQDSIWATKQLGLNYLWADKYCIDQEDSKSKHETIMKMDLIYSVAKIAIVAATGSNNSHGLSGVGSTTRTPLKSIKVSNSLAFVQIKHAKDCIRESVWATRAWTLQEGLLARRRLVFTPEQIYFECQEMQIAETILVPLDVLHKSHYVSRLEGGYFHAMANHNIAYFRLLWAFRNYSRRNLSYGTDRMNAFLGILNSMRPTMSHVWGLSISVEGDVKESFISSLGWDHDWKWFQENKNQLKQQPEFPSWSWAAWDGPKDYEKLAYTKDVQVKFYLNDNSIIDLSNKSIKDHLENLELKATHRLTLQTYILKPDSLIKRNGTRYSEYAYTLNECCCALQHYLGIGEDETVLENIRNGIFKLVYTGSTRLAGPRILTQATFIIGRNKGDSLDRIGLLKMKLDKNQDEISYLQLYAKFTSVDLT